MSCTSPLGRLKPEVIDFMPERYRARFDPAKGLICSVEEIKYIRKYIFPLRESQFQMIPCGQCLACRLDYSRQWAIRCMLEAKYHTYNIFLTLTYDDAHVPLCDVIDKNTGQILHGYQALKRKDLTDFIKRMRAYWSNHYDPVSGQGVNFACDSPLLRFFYCGEYGERSHRPHYHLIVFNCQVPDLEVIKTSRAGYKVFTSQIIQKLWGCGFVTIGAVNFNSCAYVAKYMLKKLKGRDKREQQQCFGHYFPANLDASPEGRRGAGCSAPPDHAGLVDGLPVEFVGSSRRPGLARLHFEKNSDRIYSSDRVYYVSNDEIAESQPPKYYDRLFRDFHGDDAYAKIAEKREKNAQARQKQLIEAMSMTDEELRSREDRILRRKEKKKRRDTV